jgi:hypothetical protein
MQTALAKFVHARRVRAVLQKTKNALAIVRANALAKKGVIFIEAVPISGRLFFCLCNSI